MFGISDNLLPNYRLPVTGFFCPNEEILFVTAVLLLGLTDGAIDDFTRCSVVFDNAQTFNIVQFRAGTSTRTSRFRWCAVFSWHGRAGYFHAFVACRSRPFTRLRHRHQHQPGPLRDRALPHGFSARAHDENQKIDVDAVVWRTVCDIATALEVQLVERASHDFGWGVSRVSQTRMEQRLRVQFEEVRFLGAYMSTAETNLIR